MTRVLLAFLICFAVTLAVYPLGIKLISRLKARQEILHYVENHSSKKGTPTMGGIIFILTIAVVTLAMMRDSFTLALTSVAVMVGYGIVGFLDDFLKVRYRRNLGLRAYQKIIFQLAIASLVALFAYLSPFVGTSILIPFTAKTTDIGFLAPVFVVFIFIACTNCVNLTDGLDGLAGKTSAVYLAGFVAVLFLLLDSGIFDAEHGAEIINLLVFAAAGIGGLLGFLAFNAHPARIFMGDTGSLALGGMLAILSIFTRLELIVPILGIMFVLSGISVILQVLHYKRTKKRIFLMAPLHHHFEKKGVFETKIVTGYTLATVAATALTVLLYLVIPG